MLLLLQMGESSGGILMMSIDSGETVSSEEHLVSNLRLRAILFSMCTILPTRSPPSLMLAAIDGGTAMQCDVWMRPLLSSRLSLPFQCDRADDADGNARQFS